MPWDNTELHVLSIDNKNPLVVIGNEESIMLPKFNGNDLYFISDTFNGYWNLHKLNQDNQSEIVYEHQSDLGGPAWRFGQSPYCFLDENTAIISIESKLCKLDLATKKATVFSNQLTDSFSGFGSLHLQNGNKLYCTASSPVQPTSLIRLEINEDQTIGEGTILRQSFKIEENLENYFSVPQFITFETADGTNAYGHLYLPNNADYTAPDDELPPVCFKIHGGPTSAARIGLNLTYQYWTSRGFAIFDLDYRGSTGYGRTYRHALYSNWGVSDIEDCEFAAKHLVKNNYVDENRVLIQGGSAGGYTVLAALCKTDIFKAGASYYGVADLGALTKDTHKFESRYLDQVIGPYPEMIEVYEERSPINHIDSFNCPLLLLQGDEDMVVPLNQAEMMFNAMNEKDIPTSLVVYQGEQHGFRKAENIINAVESEFSFYATVFGFAPSDNLEKPLMNQKVTK
eukprot:TRINITY_DN1453_c0_g1_i1.p1 TRINITY_DN1453_c0_g1~~TRINITY_DN1453_c0_g1_i1.p1  ORF type:complete len:456 (-),score=99.94 TRINITY_DN1453_c0_g1_i1:38-1405(-)